MLGCYMGCVEECKSVAEAVKTSLLDTYMSSGVIVTTPSADMGLVLPLPLFLPLLLWALTLASPAAPRSSFSKRPCVAAPR
jgi:hypothetical protein